MIYVCLCVLIGMCFSYC